MCLPQSYQSRSSGDREADADGGYEHEDEGAQSLGRGLIDLEATREEVVLEVLNAPKRRVDNEITRLTDSVSLLQMHLTVVDDLTKSYSSTLFRSRLYGSVATVATTVIAAGCMTLGLPLEVVLGLGITGYGTSFGLYYIQSSSINEAANKLITDDNLVSTFRRLYARKIAEKDEYTTSLWPRVHDHLSLALTSGELKQMDKVKSSDLKKLQSLLESDIPNLRRLAAPTFNQRKY